MEPILFLTRGTLLIALIVALFGHPAFAMDASPLPSPPYNPWIAAGLTYIPVAPASVAATFTTGARNPLLWRDSAAYVAMNPMPGLGHIYVGEPLRGFGFLVANLALLGGTVLANASMHSCRLCGDASGREQTRERINIGYFLVSSAFSAWAAWDAFRLAEEKKQANSASKK